MSHDYEDNTEKLIGRLAVRLILLAVGFLLLFIVAKKSFDYGKGIFYQKPVDQAPGRDVQIELTGGSDASDLASVLKEKGVIANELGVIVQAKLYKIEPEPGVYTVNTSMTPKEILKSISAQSEELKENRSQAEEQEDNESVYGGGDDGN